MLKATAVVLIVLSATHYSVARETAFWIDLGGEDFYVNYGIDAESGSVSPLVVNAVTEEGTMYVSLAYHPGEKVWYVYSFGEFLFSTEHGMYLVVGREVKELDSDFMLPRSVADAEKPREANLKELIADRISSIQTEPEKEHNQSSEVTASSRTSS